MKVFFKHSDFTVDNHTGIRYYQDMENIESVNGIVIGPVTLSVRLFTPNGHEYARSSACELESEAREWANAARDKAIAGIGLEEAKRLGWMKPWEMRIYA